jgi:protein-tyrosine-phosphatase
MAQRLFERAAQGNHAARSAGSEPGDATHPQVVQALREVGIDASDHVPHKLNAADLEWADVAVSVCGEVCPITPGVERIRWNIPDPISMPIEQVREVRDEIGRRVEELAGAL